MFSTNSGSAREKPIRCPRTEDIIFSPDQVGGYVASD
jgi:hypothetical protein